MNIINFPGRAIIYQDYTLEEVRKNKNSIDWSDFSAEAILSDDIIREFSNELDWTVLPFHQTLSEEILFEFRDKVNWEVAVHYQDMSEDLVRKLQDRINITAVISYAYSTSGDFFDESEGGLYIEREPRKGFSDDFFEDFKDRIGSTNLLRFSAQPFESIMELVQKVRYIEIDDINTSKLTLKEYNILSVHLEEKELLNRRFERDNVGVLIEHNEDDFPF